MDIFSAGDTAWVLICSLLVLLMSIPAVAFFYGGLSKRKNVLNTMFLTFIAFSIVSVIWVIFGYQFAFGTPSLGGFIGSPSNVCYVPTCICRSNSSIDFWWCCWKNENKSLGNFYPDLGLSCLHSYCSLGMGWRMVNEYGST